MKQILIIVLIGCIRLGRVSEVCTGEFQLSSSIPNHLVLMFVSFFFIITIIIIMEFSNFFYSFWF